ncbi:MAG: hypothetical protein F6J95_027490 [Leptolyngbya sp. SIO1E4]|nr:hypothetical protein [Leptolyngbya sp. SIO1E4]
MVEEKLEQAQVGVSQTPPQKEVIPQPRIEILYQRTSSGRLFEYLTHCYPDPMKLTE